ncbi:MAG: rhodanese-like domain-containing protein [Magnetovibrionaceae bacterium]
MRKVLFGLLAGLMMTGSAFAADENLKIIGDSMEVVVETDDGPFTITRHMTGCAKNKGWLQPLIPAAGIHPVTEIEVLNALGDDSFVVVDMRTVEWRTKATIPGSVHIPYTEVAMRLDELGCSKKSDGTFECASPKKVVGFCNGPVCPQSPMAMKAMIREGFPAENIYYYRGGMLDWDALGLSVLEGAF